MQVAIKLIPALIALLFLVMGINLLVDPVAGAAQVGLEPLGVDGLSTVRGDLAGLFLTGTLLLALGIWRNEGSWLVAVAILMLVIAGGRIVGFVVDGSPGEGPLTAFGFELLIAAGLFYASRRMQPAAGRSGGG